MKALSALACLSTILGFACNAHASTAFYLRPSVQFTKIALDDDLTSSRKLGYGIAVGLSLGARQSFNFELEAASTPGLEAHRVKKYYGHTETLHEKIDFNQYLFAFKYTYCPKDSAMGILIGPTAGYWTVKGTDTVSSVNYYATTQSPAANYSISESGVLLGPVLGTFIKVNDHAKIELAYRHLWMLGSDSSQSGSYSGGLVGHLTRQFYVSYNYTF